MNIAIATCRAMPEPDQDQDLLMESLAAAGHQARLVPWDDPGQDLESYELCVLRSTWNYPEHAAAFEAWLGVADQKTRLRNPADIARWNLHKGYLLELESRGVPIVPTAFVSRGIAARLDSILSARGWNDVVIKPAISAGSLNTERFQAHQMEEGQAFLTRLSQQADVLIQRYEPSVERGGERATVWIDGEFTHAISKAPRFCGDDESVSKSLALEADELVKGQELLEPFAERLLYARVDWIRGPEGELLLAELELIEPSLFLLQEPKALERFVGAIGRA